MKKEEIKFKHLEDPAFKVHHSRRTFGQKAADKVTEITGSWGFILFLFVILLAWVAVNSYFLVKYSQGPFDPYPFVFLNLVLACLAVIQAPIILMSQNREAQKDRIKNEYDYQVNKKAEEEIREIKELLRRKLK
ncbi:Uncharacterised protein [uncultured archaeon]|nr:Uncharacterised protein [uncultured archaeon]